MKPDSIMSSRISKGGIQPGTVATSPESSQSEKNHTKWIREVISEMGSGWKIEKSITIEEIIGKTPVYALNKKGESQSWESDGGYFYRQSKSGEWILVGAAENKWQKNRENACERAFRYLGFLKGNQIFVSCSGPGFTKMYGGGATGPMIDVLMYSGAYLIENVSEEQEFKKHFYTWIRTFEV
jgi:hypothetical protein